MGVNYDLDWYFGSGLVLIKRYEDRGSRVRSDTAIQRKGRRKKKFAAQWSFD